MLISSMWDVKESTHYSKRACECMGGYREGDVPRMGLNVHSHITLHNSVQELLKQTTKKKDRLGVWPGRGQLLVL